MKVVYKIVETIITILLLFVIIVDLFLIINGNKNKIPNFLGYKPFIIVSGSMEPEIMTHDLIITKEVSEESIEVGDILSYVSSDGYVVTHRVIKINNNDGKNNYVFKGDNNNVNDCETVTYSQIEGEYLFAIPFIGSIALYIQTPIGLSTSIILIIILYFIMKVIKTIINNGKKDGGC